LAELLAYRELVTNLALREFRIKHKRSMLGALWSFLNPLFMMLIYTTVFNVILRVVSVPQYWALILSGLLPWIFLSSALTAATTSFAYNSNLITKVYFPIESLSIASVLSNFINFLISLAVLLPILFVAGRPLGASLLALPIIVIAQLGLCVGMGLLLAALNVYFRDLEYLLGLGLTALFYVSPVLYPLSKQALPHTAEKYLSLLKLNPISWYLESYHYVLYWGTWPSLTLMALMLTFSAASLLVGYGAFLVLRNRIPEEV
jgi:ABC-2 type transport system permease protein